MKKDGQRYRQNYRSQEWQEYKNDQRGGDQYKSYKKWQFQTLTSHKEIIAFFKWDMEEKGKINF